MRYCRRAERMAGKLTIAALRRQAVLGSLLPPTTLARAIAAAGFVQADPIRAPARAQDLILRHRVTGYRAGDLERRFARLGLEEDFLYAYGFMPRETASAAASARSGRPRAAGRCRTTSRPRCWPSCATRARHTRPIWNSGSAASGR